MTESSIRITTEGAIEPSFLSHYASNLVAYHDLLKSYVAEPSCCFVAEHQSVSTLLDKIRQVKKLKKTEDVERIKPFISKTVDIIKATSKVDINFEIEGWYDEKQSWLVVLHFPELKIRNSRKEYHTLRDLVFLMFFTEYGVNRFVLKEYEMLRTTMTPKEIDKGYYFSHTQSQSPSGRKATFPTATSFCTGTDNVVSFANAASRVLSDLPDFVFLFEYLLTYLQWESIEGGPYVSIAKLKNSIRDQITKQTLKNRYSEKDTNVRLRMLTNITRTDLSHFEIVNVKQDESEQLRDEQKKVYKNKITGFQFKSIKLEPKLHFETTNAVTLNSHGHSTFTTVLDRLRHAKRDIYCRNFIDTMLAGT
jgi:hypothetical protein